MMRFLKNNANDTTTGTLTANSFELGDEDYIGIGSALERIVFDTAGDITVQGANFGIGTTSPAAALAVVGDIYNTGDIVVGNGLGKITVGTIDPVYTIEGVDYSTYVAGMIGLKEETTGVATINTETTDSNGNIGYTHTIDFDTQEAGSDLWLFAKATQLEKNIDQLVVLLTPEGNSKVWYSLHKAENKLILISDQPTTVSYRLTAPRFDYEQWTNYNHDNVQGFNPPDTDDEYFTDAAPVLSFNENSQLTEFIGAVFTKLNEFGVTFVNGVTHITQAVIGTLTIGSSEKPSGITLYDEVTGDPYCLKIRNGAALPFAGECGSEASEPIEGTTSVETSTPIEILINGNNPATITTGTTYNDLGAIASSTDQTLTALGVRTFYQGEEVQSVNIDTATSSTHTIHYKVIDGEGTTLAEAIREVIVGETTTDTTTEEDTATTTEETTEGTVDEADTATNTENETESVNEEDEADSDSSNDSGTEDPTSETIEGDTVNTDGSENEEETVAPEEGETDTTENDDASQTDES
ncbi:MAG: immunoglobulin-like domain-containing protein [Patescibacteria group bacterium UBA2163]